MTPTFRIARVFGVDVRVHITFVALLVLLVAWEVLPVSEALGSADEERVFSPFIILALFGLAGLHELGHALVARRMGVHVEDILILPILLMVRLRLPRRAGTELAVAAAGPAVNLVLAGLMLAILPRVGFPAEDLVAWPPGSLLPLLFWTNLLMGTVNLLPAFPLDGGRILRALLAFRVDYLTATRVAMVTGWLVVLVAGGLATLRTDSLVFAVVAVFLIILGRREEEGVRLAVRHDELLAMRDRLRELGFDGNGGGHVSPWGDFRRLRDPVFRASFDRYRDQLEALREEARRSG